MNARWPWRRGEWRCCRPGPAAGGAGSLAERPRRLPRGHRHGSLQRCSSALISPPFTWKLKKPAPGRPPSHARRAQAAARLAAATGLGLACRPTEDREASRALDEAVPPRPQQPAALTPRAGGAASQSGRPGAGRLDRPRPATKDFADAVAARGDMRPWAGDRPSSPVPRRWRLRAPIPPARHRLRKDEAPAPATGRPTGRADQTGRRASEQPRLHVLAAQRSSTNLQAGERAVLRSPTATLHDTLGMVPAGPGDIPAARRAFGLTWSRATLGAAAASRPARATQPVAAGIANRHRRSPRRRLHRPPAVYAPAPVPRRWCLRRSPPEPAAPPGRRHQGGRRPAGGTTPGHRGQGRQRYLAFYGADRAWKQRARGCWEPTAGRKLGKGEICSGGCPRKLQARRATYGRRSPATSAIGPATTATPGRGAWSGR